MKLKVEKVAAALQGIESGRQLSREVVEDALIEAMTKAYRKQIDLNDAYVKVEIKDDDIHIYHQRMVVDEVEDDLMEISLADAKKVSPSAVLGDLVNEEVDFSAFDRASVVLAKNVMKQKIREAEKQQVYEEYADKKDEMVPGTIETVEDKFVLVDIGKTLAMMKKGGQIPGEVYREGQRLPVIITNVDKETKGAQVIVSRSTPVFVRRLFEKEVPEIYKGIIEIKAIARDAGERTKIAVYSHNENIDPIGACIGPRGARVQTIINELGGEKIDIFEWSDDIQKLIKNALSPSETLAVLPNPFNDEEEKTGRKEGRAGREEEKDSKPGLVVVVPDSQLSLAIGKRGKNARLAVKLSGHKIDIKSKSQMEELGIDYMAEAEKMHQEYEEKKAKELAYKQQLKKDEFASLPAEIEEINIDDFTISDLEQAAETYAAKDSLFEKEQEDIKEAARIDLPATEEEVDEMEEAARLARELRKTKTLGEDRSYISKFEDFASSKGSEQPASAKKKEEPAVKAEKKEKKKPVFGGMKPIYSDEELAEIQEQEENDIDAWDEDIDYEDYDSYYDD